LSTPGKAFGQVAQEVLFGCFDGDLLDSVAFRLGRRWLVFRWTHPARRSGSPQDRDEYGADEQGYTDGIDVAERAGWLSGRIGCHGR